MKAVLCRSYGKPENLRLEEITDPIPGPSQVLVEVAASAVNFPDVLMIEGNYQNQPPMPFSPGGEFSGTIVEIGADCKKFKKGDKVFGNIGFGAFAEKLVAPEIILRAIPDNMSFVVASAISTTYGTSYYGLKNRASLAKGETLLVTGAGGGVGLSAVELGKAFGAHVIAAASSEEKLAAAKVAGADETINYSDGFLKDKVKEITKGKGVDVIYDPVGGDLFDQCIRTIGWNGRVLIIGFAAGSIPKIPTNLILLKSCQLVGVFYGAWAQKFPLENEEVFDEISKLFILGKINPMVSKTFQLSDYAEALNCLAERRAIGKIVVETK